jgi:membrane-bound metal-dependent hydrolase YbcI (DUF457 family)
MSNGTTHRLVAFGVGTLAVAHHETAAGRKSLLPLLGGAVASVLTNLPDWLEPALHPNHRQFFHSILFATIVAKCMQAVHQWQPKTESDKLLRGVLLVGGGAYLTHLLLDFFTAKSLPLVGKL